MLKPTKERPLRFPLRLPKKSPFPTLSKGLRLDGQQYRPTMADVAGPYKTADWPEEVYATAAVRDAWARLMRITVVNPLRAFSSQGAVSWKFSAAKGEHLGQDGSAEYVAIPWNPIATLRPMRDAFAFELLSIGLRWDNKGDPGAATTADIEDAVKGAAQTVEEVKAWAEKIATIATSIAGTAGAAGAVGVIAGIGGAVGAALSWTGVAVAIVAALAAIAAGIAAAVEGAKDPEKVPYVIRGQAKIQGIADAISLRYKGARLSDALARIPVRDVVFTDGMGDHQAKSPTLGVNIDSQRALEDFAANYLLNFKGLPRFYQEKERQLVEQSGVDPYTGWLGRGEPIGDPSRYDAVWTAYGEKVAPMSVRRLLFAWVCGLGEEEAAWLALEPGTRPQAPKVPR
ncbi:MAG: hypothetical protein HOV80_22070 [Polyangiaceae bacterium]|nr:hypothetical protein [Polyangiaceae bacterium]